MALSITPGYDFTVNETPNTTTVNQTASGLSISGLTLENVAATLIGQLSGNTSGDTGASLPQEAWMWASPDGTIWVETMYTDSDVTEAVPTPLWSPGGGWHSTRFKYAPASGIAIAGQGAIVNISDNLAEPNNPLSVRHYEKAYNVLNAAHFVGTYSHATPTSGYSGTHGLVVAGRGVAPMFLHTNTITQAPAAYGWRQNYTTAQWPSLWTAIGPPDGTRVFFTNTIGAHPGSSVSGANYTAMYMSYLFATGMWGP